MLFDFREAVIAALQVETYYLFFLLKKSIFNTKKQNNEKTLQHCIKTL